MPPASTNRVGAVSWVWSFIAALLLGNQRVGVWWLAGRRFDGGIPVGWDGGKLGTWTGSVGAVAAQLTLWPPSTLRMWPVMDEASSDVMKTIAAASSSDRPRRAIGTSVTRAAMFSGVPVKRVSMPVSVGGDFCQWGAGQTAVRPPSTGMMAPVM